MLQIKNISKKFNNLQVINNITCSVASQDFVVIMGPNGTGKSTFFDIIAGKTIPDSGSVHIDTEDVTHVPEKERVMCVGRLLQNTHQGSCSHLSVRENLALASLKKKNAGLRHGIKALEEEIIETFLVPLKLNLEKLLDVPMGTLSGGQRQIITFVMLILHQPKVLLLDEPTAALDPLSATKLLLFAKSYAAKHKTATLLITHDPQIAKHMGNRLWILEKGTIAREFGEEKSNLSLKELYHQVEYTKL